jgi:hypothetical protein
MTNALDLVDEEFDPIDLQLEIESAFGLRLTDEEAWSVRTMGDLHALLMRRIEPSMGESCLTTMAFLRLRRAIAPIVPGIRLRPSTLLSAIPAKSPRALFDSIRLENGLRLPALEKGTLTDISGILFMSLCAIVPILALLEVSWLAVGGVIVGVIALMWPLQHLDPLRFPSRCESLGDLSRAIAAHNASALAREGAELDSDTVWQSLVQIVAPYALTPKADIGRDTTILRGASV